MQHLTLHIENESIIDNLLWMLKHFENDGVKVEKNNLKTEQSSIVEYTDEYIEANWKDMASKALSSVDADSDEWKMEYGSYLAEKHK